MKIEFTRQAFTDYITPILERAFDGDKEAQQVIKGVLFEGYALDVQQTNLKAQMYDAVTVIKGLLEKGHRNAKVALALKDPDVLGAILDFLNKINAQPAAHPFECAQAADNPAHACFNQCYVCRFPADRTPKAKPNGAK